METEKFNEYLTSRYQPEIAWYDRRSGQNKILFIIFQWAVIILSATIPVLTMYLDNEKKLFLAGLGVILAIGTAGLKSFKFQENWLNYRTICETLKKERYYYDAGLSGYKEAADREALFIERVESLISRENSLWLTVQQQNKEADGAKKK